MYWQFAPLLVRAIMSVLISDHESGEVDEGILRLLFFYFDITHNILYLQRIRVQEETRDPLELYSFERVLAK